MSNQPELPSLDIPKDDVTPLPPVPNTPTTSNTPTPNNQNSSTPTAEPTTPRGLNKRKSSVINVLHSTPRWKQIVSATIGDKSATQSLIVRQIALT